MLQFTWQFNSIHRIRLVVRFTFCFVTLIIYNQRFGFSVRKILAEVFKEKKVPFWHKWQFCVLKHNYYATGDYGAMYVPLTPSPVQFVCFNNAVSFICSVILPYKIWDFSCPDFNFPFMCFYVLSISMQRMQAFSFCILKIWSAMSSVAFSSASLFIRFSSLVFFFVAFSSTTELCYLSFAFSMPTLHSLVQKRW